MLDAISILLAVPGLAALAVKLLQKLARVVSKYKDANKLIEEKSLILENHIQKLQLEVEEFHDVSPDLPKDLYAHFGKLFIMLRGKLASFEAELDGFLEADKLLGAKVVLATFDKMTEGAEFWQRKVEDLFEQLARFPKPFKDPRIPNPKTALGRVKLVNQAIFCATESTPAELDLGQTQLPGTTQLLPSSSVSVTVAGERMIVETKSVSSKTPKAQLNVMTKDVIDLARVLSAEDISTRGVLKCKGYRYNEIQQDSEIHGSFLLMFGIPDNLRNARSLRNMLLDKDFRGQVKHPLNDRLSLAKQLARAVLHVHSKGLVHKNIRPEIILLFEDAGNDGSGSERLPGNTKAFPASLGQAFLTGFEKVRKDEADTVPIGDTTWAEDIYRHPSRQGPSHSEDKFSMLHDVYSLGVCLLEVAIWRSFVDVETQAGKVVKTNNTKACNIMEPGGSGLAPRMLSPKEIQKKFTRDAKNRIPIALGERFSRVVVRCLSCVETFEQDTEQDPLLLGMRYIETVLSELEEIVL